MVLFCLPGASQAVQLVLSCLPGASLVPPSCPTSPFLPPWCLLVPRRLSNWSFPASLVPPWCLLGCQIVLSCLPGASLRSSGVPGTSRTVQMVFQWRLAVSRVSKIKSGLGRFLESVGLALADYWCHPVVGI